MMIVMLMGLEGMWVGPAEQEIPIIYIYIQLTPFCQRFWSIWKFFFWGKHIDTHNLTIRKFETYNLN